MKKLFTIIIIILILIGLGVGLWLFFNQKTTIEPGGSPGTNPTDTFPISQPNNPPPLTFDPSDPTQPNPSPSTNPDTVNPVLSSQLIQLGTKPVAGYKLFPSATSTESDRIIFLERDTGQVLTQKLNDQELQILAHLPINPPTEGVIEKVYWGKIKDTLVLVYSTLSSSGRTYARVNFNPLNESLELAPIELAPEKFNPQTTSLAVHPTSPSVFTLETLTDGQIGKVFDLVTNSSRLVFESKFTSWQSQWNNGEWIALNTRPANQADGFLYLLNPQTGNLDKVLGGIPGLTTLPSLDQTKVLYADNNLNLKLYRRDNNENLDLALKTLPEKCLWVDNNSIYCAVPRNIPLAIYPNDWLSGKVVFNDLLWYLDLASKKNNLVLANDEGLGDATQLNLTSAGRLVFINQTNRQLYVTQDIVTPQTLLDEQNTRDQ